MSYFLLLYRRSKGELIEIDEFPPEQRETAFQLRLEREIAHRRNPDVEVVVLSAPSRADLERTHSRYFKSVSELAGESVEGTS